MADSRHDKHNILKVWISEYSDYLYSWTLRKVKDDSNAKDLVQETFIAAAQNFDTFRHGSSPKTWLFSILKRKTANFFRAEAKRNIVSLTEFNETDDWFDAKGKWRIEKLPNSWNTAGPNMLDDPEFEKKFIECLHDLPRGWQACINLKYFNEKSALEICQEIGISPTNYWQMLHRAKLQLRSCLENKWFKNEK